MLGEWKENTQTNRKYLQNIYLRKSLLPEYVNKSQNSYHETNNTIKNVQRIWTDTSKKKM